MPRNALPQHAPAAIMMPSASRPAAALAAPYSPPATSLPLPGSGRAGHGYLPAAEQSGAQERMLQQRAAQQQSAADADASRFFQQQVRLKAPMVALIAAVNLVAGEHGTYNNANVGRTRCYEALLALRALVRASNSHAAH